MICGQCKKGYHYRCCSNDTTIEDWICEECCWLKRSPDVDYFCNKCKNGISELDKALGCNDLCNKWFHIKCIDVPIRFYNYLIGRNNFTWKCDTCINTNECKSNFQDIKVGDTDNSSLVCESSHIITKDILSKSEDGLSLKSNRNVKFIFSKSCFENLRISDGESQDPFDGQKVDLKSFPNVNTNVAGTYREILSNKSKVDLSMGIDYKVTGKPCNGYLNYRFDKEPINNINTKETFCGNRGNDLGDLISKYRSLEKKIILIEDNLKSCSDTIDLIEVVLKKYGFLLKDNDINENDNIHLRLYDRFTKLKNYIDNSNTIGPISRHSSRINQTSSPVSVDRIIKEGSSSTNFTKLNQIIPRYKIHIFGDSNGRVLSSLLQKNFPQFQVSSTIIPGANYRNILKACNELSSGFTHNDIVIFMGGTIDVTHRVKLGCGDYSLFGKLCLKTNIIIISVLNRFDNPVVNLKVFEFNRELRNIADTFGSSFLYVNKTLGKKDFNIDGIYLNNEGKCNIVSCLKLFFLNGSKVDSNSNEMGIRIGRKRLSTLGSINNIKELAKFNFSCMGTSSYRDNDSLFKKNLTLDYS